MWARSICNSLSWFMYGFKSVRLAWPVRRFVSALFFYMFPSLKSRQLLFRLRFFFYLECGICFNLSHTTCTNLRHYIVTYFLFEYFHPYRKNTTCPTCWPSPYWTSILGNLSFNVILQEHIVSDMKYTVSNERRPILLWQFIVWYHNIIVSEAW